MNILNEIIEAKKKAVEAQKKISSIEILEKSPFFNQPIPSLKASLLDQTKNGIIAEHKRQSPSKGVINDEVMLEEVVSGYELAGVSGISVLTDEPYFGGHIEDVIRARSTVKIPILRKDFMIDPFQVIEARSIGASAILLIAACLENKQALELAKLAKELGLDVLMEVHSIEELDRANDYVDIIGVNNRDLKTFEVDLENSVKIAQHIPNNCVKISESGIYSPKDIVYLREHGFKGFLIGENFMREEKPGEACQEFSKELAAL